MKIDKLVLKVVIEHLFYDNENEKEKRKNSQSCSKNITLYKDYVSVHTVLL